MNYALIIFAIGIAVVFTSVPYGISPIAIALTLTGLVISFFAIRIILKDEFFIKEIKKRFSD